jgi:hypothetical protein
VSSEPGAGHTDGQRTKEFDGQRFVRNEPYKNKTNEKSYPLRNISSPYGVRANDF